MRAIFQYVADGRLTVISSTITLAEVLVMPKQTGNYVYEQAYREMLLNTDHIETQAVTHEIAEQAAALRATYRLRTPDALHVATAIVTRCDAFLTNDYGLERVKEIAVLVVDDLDIDSLETAPEP
jgi:predicted nucleic acid-binding protein